MDNAREAKTKNTHNDMAQKKEKKTSRSLSLN